MRRFVIVVLLASLLPLACDSSPSEAGPREAKASDAKTPKVEPEPPTPASPAPAAEVAPEPAPPAEDEYGSEFCETIIPCYQELEFAGNFMADVSVDIEPDGSVSAVSFTGEAPTPVKTCITNAIKATTLAAYNGKPGRTRCTKSGQLMGGTQMIMSDRTYEVREVGPAKAKAKAG